MSKKHRKAQVTPTAADDIRHADNSGLHSPSYRLAYADESFLLKDELRAVRLQLEWLKPDLVQDEQGIDSTVVVFGGARFREDDHSDENSSPAVSYYQEARQFARRVTQLSLAHNRREYVITTGGGPGIMEAANRGAQDAGGISIGLNIVLPYEQTPNAYITPDLCFQFHYFAVRKMHFLNRAVGLVAFPGGFGTMDELFETLTLVQTRKVDRFPIVLVGRDYWSQAINFQFLADQGAISQDDMKLFSLVDSADEALNVLCDAWGVCPADEYPP